MKDDRIFLLHILECLRRVEENAAFGREQFMRSHTLQDAVLRNLQTMAETTQRLSDETKALQPQVPWPEITAFRNVLVHDYLGIDIEIVWDITQDEAPELKSAIEAILHSLS
ncbi:MAG: DUF86 domain-containing protein [Caldilineales bacterium]|nr:DUF86 domain-containing protein [Caldilineales bacterium]